jgi:hypothetical protein
MKRKRTPCKAQYKPNHASVIAELEETPAAKTTLILPGLGSVA